ncbi:MAG: 2-oxoacid:acceptor oxidoreductase subunit alpha [Bacillota bacterium]
MPNDKVMFTMGNVACAQAALDVGAKFYAGYPITPSSEVAEVCSRLMPKYGGVYIQMEDEISSIAAMVGASLAGVKSFTATSGPGYSLMQENLGFAIYAEVPCVIINVMRSGPSTGLATRPGQADLMQVRWGTHGDHPIIALCPSSVQECYDLTIKAFNLSEKFRIPVILLSDEIVAHTRENVTLKSPEEIEIVNRKRPTCPPAEYLCYKPEEDGIPLMAAYGEEYMVHASSSCHDETGYSNNSPKTAEGLIHRLHQKIARGREEIVQVAAFGPQDAEIMVVAYGATARAAKQAVVKAQEKGMSVGLLQIITMWPFPDKEILALCDTAKALVVPEMNLGQAYQEIEKVCRGKLPVYLFSRVDGEAIKPGQVLTKIEEVAQCLKS